MSPIVVVEERERPVRTTITLMAWQLEELKELVRENHYKGGLTEAMQRVVTAGLGVAAKEKQDKAEAEAAAKKGKR